MYRNDLNCSRHFRTVHWGVEMILNFKIIQFWMKEQLIILFIMHVLRKFPFHIYKCTGHIKMNGKIFLCIVIAYVLNSIKYRHCEKRTSILSNWKRNIYEEDCPACDDNADNEIPTTCTLYNCMIIFLTLCNMWICNGWI